MQQSFIQYQEEIVHFHQYGQGHELWIAFHGFAQDGQVFAALEAYLPPQACLIAIDLPWHGASSWSKSFFTLNDIQALIEELLNRFQQKQYTAIGFSFGARLWLALAQQESRRWDRLILLAPDGLPGRNFWYSFFDQIPFWIKKQLSFLIDRPTPLLATGKTLYKLKMLNAFTWKFLQRNLQTEANRKRLKGLWLSTAAFPSMSSTCNLLSKKTGLEILLIYGARDQVISAVSYAYLEKKLPRAQCIVLSKTGHDLMTATIVSQWATSLFKNAYPNTHPE